MIRDICRSQRLASSQTCSKLIPDDTLEDINYVANWLAQTARRCGYTISAPPSTVVTSSGPKWRGRKGKPKAPPQKRRILIKDYTSLSRQIAQHQPPVIVPISFVNTAKRAIKARQLTSRHYNATGSPPKNDGHAYFVDVLESVLDVLKANFQAQQLDSCIKSLTTISGVTNAFSNLEVEESSEAPPSAPAADVKPQSPVPVVVEFEAEPMKKEEAEDFAAVCLMNDIDHIMNYVKHLWQLYADGKVELVAASVTAMFAIMIVDRLEDQYLTETERFDDKDYDYAVQVARRRYDLQCKSSGVNATSDLVSDEEVAVTSSYASPNFALSTLLAIIEQLTEFKHHYNADDTPVYQPGEDGVIDMSRSRLEKSSKEKIEDDKIVLRKVLPLMRYAWTAGLDKIQHMPEPLLCSLHAYASGEEYLSLSLAFAAQAYLEAYHIVGNRAEAAFREVQVLGQSIKMSAMETLNLSEEARKDQSRANYPVQDLVNVIDKVVFRDEGHEVAKRVLRDKKVDEPAPPKFALMRQHPLLCGTIAFMLAVSAQSTGTYYCTRWIYALPCAHLLNAIQQEKLCDSTWEEMDLMLKHQTPEYIFFGGHPTTPAQYSTRLSMAFGVSATTFARNRRTTKLKIDSKLSHQLKECTPVSCFMRDWRCVLEDHHTSDFEALLNKLFEPASQEDDAAAGADQFKGVQRKQRSSAGRTTQAKSGVAPRLSPVELVQATEASLSAEVDALKFDYLVLHQQCWKLLQRFKTKLSHTVASMEIKPGQFEFMDLVYDVLAEYAGRLAAAEGSSKKQAAAINPKEHFGRFAEVFEEYLQELEQERKGNGRFRELEWNEQFAELAGFEKFEEPTVCWQTCLGSRACSGHCKHAG